MGSIVIGILLLVIVVGIVWKLRSDQKKGKHSCGGTCGGCPNAAHCLCFMVCRGSVFISGYFTEV